MARSVNQVILLGRLTRDPEERSTASGKTVVNFSIAVDRGNDETDFFEITAWEKLAELVVKYLEKGRQVLVQGRLRQETWDDKDSGKKRSKIAITASDITFLGGGSQETGERKQRVKEDRGDDVVLEDIDDTPIDLSEIPF